MTYTNKEIHNASIAILLKQIIDAKEREPYLKAFDMIMAYVTTYLPNIKNKHNIEENTELYESCKKHIAQRINKKESIKGES